jgi:hypothetical protein
MLNIRQPNEINRSYPKVNCFRLTDGNREVGIVLVFFTDRTRLSVLAFNGICMIFITKIKVIGWIQLKPLNLFF